MQDGAEFDSFKILDEYLSEIADCIGAFTPLLCHYLLLLDREQYQFSPYHVFLFGKRSKQANIPYHAACWNYLKEHHELPMTRKREVLMLNLYGMLSHMLDGKHRHLLDYLTSEYRALYGAVSRNILEIIKMGYDADDDSKA